MTDKNFSKLYIEVMEIIGVDDSTTINFGYSDVDITQNQSTTTDSVDDLDIDLNYFGKTRNKLNIAKSAISNKIGLVKRTAKTIWFNIKDITSTVVEWVRAIIEWVFILIGWGLILVIGLSMLGLLGRIVEFVRNLFA